MTIPRCCGRCRTDAVDAIAWLLAVDAHHVYADLVDAGWSAVDAADAVDREYRSWLQGVVDSAVDVALVLREARP